MKHKKKNIEPEYFLDAARHHFLAFCCLMEPKFLLPEHIKIIARHLKQVEKGKIRKLAVFLPPRHGKLIADHTPVLTPNGWTSHGALKVGDEVFNSQGLAIKIIATSPKDRADYKVTLGNGEIIYCHENHEWVVEDRWQKNQAIQLETKQLSTFKLKYNENSKKERYRFFLPNIHPLHFTHQPLLMPPYVLGVWLGDGSSSKACITHPYKDKAIIQKIEEYGYEITATHIHKITGVYTTAFSGKTPGKCGKMGSELRKLNLHKNKHIPEIYKRASIEQRLELIAGLIDTDGFVDKTGRVIITTGCEQLYEDIIDVLTSLNQRPYVEIVQPCLSSSGIQGRKVIYRIGFQPTLSIPTVLERKKITRIITQRRIPVVSIEYDPQGYQGKCIQIDDPNGLYLVGKKLIPTHNSETISKLFPAWYLGRNPEKQLIFSTYAQDFADDFGRNVRNRLASPEFQAIFPECRLADDSASVRKFATTAGGNFFSVGAGGPITGRGGDCVSADSLIYTTHGLVCIEKLCSMRRPYKVLTYNHKTSSYEYHKIQAYQCIPNRYVRTLATNIGNSIKVTDDHLIYIKNKGYIPASEVQIGDQIMNIDWDLDPVSAVLGINEKIETISDLHPDPVDVYDIQVEQNHNFFASNILVHNCIIIDDPHKNRAEANSATFRKRINQWFKSTLYTRMSPEASIILVQTRWHQDDLAGNILAEEGDQWNIINMPAINEYGEPLWPEQWPIERLEKIKKTIGSYEWAALYQQNPSPEEGGVFESSWFEVVPAAPAKAKRVRYWDRAATIAKNGSDPDWTVGIKMAKDKDGVIYIEDMCRFRGSSLDVQRTISNISSQDGVLCKIGLEQDPGQAGKAEVEYLIRMLQGYNVRAYPVQKDKVTRALPLSAQAEAGNVKIVQGSWNKDFLEEVGLFPFGKHDDAIDASSGAFQMMNEPSIDYINLIKM